MHAVYRYLESLIRELQPFNIYLNAHLNKIFNFEPSSVLNLWLAKCISTKIVKVTRKRFELKRQCTENVAAMNEKETYATPKAMLVSAIVFTCLWFITALAVLSGVYGHDFFAIMYLVIYPVFLVLLWREVAEKNKNLSKRWVRCIQTVLVVITILLIASYYHLL